MNLLGQMHLDLQNKGISPDTRILAQLKKNNLITSFIQKSAGKHIPSKTSRSISSVPWITPAIRRKIRRKNTTHAKAKQSNSAKIRAKFETLRREIKADIRKQRDFNVNNLVGDVKANSRDFYRYINSQKKDAQVIPPLKKRNGCGVAQSGSEKAADSMVISLMCSLNPNTVRSLFWIDQPRSWKILLLPRKELQSV